MFGIRKTVRFKINLKIKSEMKIFFIFILFIGMERASEALIGNFRYFNGEEKLILQ